MTSADIVQLVCVVLAPALGLAAWCGQRYLARLWGQLGRLQNQVQALLRERDALRQRHAQARTNWRTCYQYGTAAQQRLRQQQQRIADLSRRLNEADSSPRPDPRLALLQGQVAELESQLHESRAERQALVDRARAAEHRSDGLAEQLRQAAEGPEQKIAALNDQYEELKRRAQHLEDELAAKSAALEQARADAFEHQRRIIELEEEAEEAVEPAGRVWERPVPPEAPAFVPLAERRVPILSVINLKGGVGKTTVAANLAVALADQGARVLLIDLDYQRSLSLLCCSPKQVEQLHRSERCLQHFLLDPAPDADHLLRCTVPVRAADQCSVVVNSESLTGRDAADSLEDAEMYLLAEWLMHPGGADVRLHLRRALHSPLIRKQYDYVLLDCPPRLSTACVNALAASDYALIPVLLDMTSAVSAPNLLRKLWRLRTGGLLAPLGVLGVLANRVRYYGGRMKTAEAAVWDEMRRPCQEAWGEPVHFFETTIKESAAVAEAVLRHTDGKATHTFAAQKGELQSVFAELADQVKARIDHDCRRLAAVPS
jgi:cellulose biosynthesis protein BcsQ/predicted  nucleic acid-binding Zn-ribbon protein